jgi:thiol-disulfide isomerase/thioredoxin
MILQKNPYIIFGLGAALIVLVAVIIYLIYIKSSPPPPTSSNGQQGGAPTAGAPPIAGVPKQKQVVRNHSPPGPPPRPHGGGPPQGIMKPSQKDVETVVGGGGSSMVLFHSDHCGHCVNMLPAWEETKQNLSQGSQFDVIAFENGQNPQEVQKNNIKGFPTVRFYPDGYPSSNFVEYRGNRSAESFIKFAQSGGQEM